VHPVGVFFTSASNGTFHRDSAHVSEGNLPKIIGIDPGQINIWCASSYSVGAEYLGMDGRVEYLGFVIFRIRNIVLLNPNTSGHFLRHSESDKVYISSFQQDDT